MGEDPKALLISARSLVQLAAGIEVVTGVTLILAPSLFAALLLGGELDAAGSGLARLGGFSLLSLVWAVWPREPAVRGSAVQAMSAFSALCALYLLQHGLRSAEVGVVLWPAVTAHGVLAVLLTLRSTRGGSP